MSTANRRAGIRSAPKGSGTPGEIRVEGREIPVLVVDESVIGIGVIAVNVPSLRVGAVVDFHSNRHRKESRIASLSTVDLAGTDITRIGLEWVD